MALTPKEQAAHVNKNRIRYPGLRFIALTPEESAKLKRNGVMKVLPDNAPVAATRPRVCSTHLKPAIADGPGMVIFGCGCRWNDPSRN
ncbi:MAG: hypothetical protein ACTHKU_11330 [Verrucomicrobiota bacterium]